MKDSIIIGMIVLMWISVFLGYKKFYAFDPIFCYIYVGFIIGVSAFYFGMRVGESIAKKTF